MDERTENRRAELVRILEALNALEQTQEWAVMRELVYGRELGTVDRLMSTESMAREVDLPELYRLQGRRALAARLCDLPRMAEGYKTELENINKNRNA